jgi:hypothetical protein
LQDEETFNSVLVLSVFTLILGPILTKLFAPGMIEPGACTEP